MQALRSIPPPWQSGSDGDVLDATFSAVSRQGFIQFHPALAERLGFKAALFLGHALYWSRHLAKTQPKRNGWFFMTARQWQQATGLTTREQTSIREQLVQQGLLVEMVAGKPARMHFRIDLASLADWAGLHADENGSSGITWEAFSPWMRSCISFYRPLVDAAGSVSAALYLSYLLQAQRVQARSSSISDGFFPVSQEDVRIALCLGPKTQRNARDKLKHLGLLHERYGLARVDLRALMHVLGEASVAPTARATRAAHVRIAPSSDSSAASTLDSGGHRWIAESSTSNGSAGRQQQLPLIEKLDRVDATDALVHSTMRMFAPNVQVAALAQFPQDGLIASSEVQCQRSALLSKLEPALLSKPGPKVAESANHTCPFVETNLPFCRTHIQEQSNTTTTTTGAHASVSGPSFDKTAGRRRIPEISESSASSSDASAKAAPSVRQNDAAEEPKANLSMPKALHPDWHVAVRQTLTAAPQEVRQLLLDELEGQLGIAGKTIANPPGYLHALIRRYAQGDLVLAMADQVAAVRAQRERSKKAIDQAQMTPAVPATESSPNATTADSLIAQQSLERLRELRRQFAGGGGK